MIRERERSAISGLAALLVLLGLLPVLGRGLIGAARAASIGEVIGWLAALVLVVISFAGLFVVNPKEGLVLQLFGDYKGTVTTAGLRWANPFYSKRRISQRVRNFESSHLKVNDTDANPVEIAAVVVWRVVDTAEA
jgi:regulator of protease activity HflC (stomatin/prohibitin superfamily)